MDAQILQGPDYVERVIAAQGLSLKDGSKQFKTSSDYATNAIYYNVAGSVLQIVVE
jgi:hypothetical protein